MPVALNPKEIVGDKSAMTLFPTFSFTPSFEHSMIIKYIPTYLHRQMLYLLVALNPKEILGDMSEVVLLPTLPYSPSLSTL